MSRLIIEKHAQLWTVKFHNPPSHLMDGDTVAELGTCLDAIEADGNVSEDELEEIRAIAAEFGAEETLR